MLQLLVYIIFYNNLLLTDPMVFYRLAVVYYDEKTFKVELWGPDPGQ